MSSDKVTMRAIAVTKYGDVNNLENIEVPKPSNPEGHDILVKIKACSVNPVDTKVCAGVYDDYPDYYTRSPPPVLSQALDLTSKSSKPGTKSSTPAARSGKAAMPPSSSSIRGA